MKDRRSMCPVSYFLDFFGDKWTLLILRDMLIFDKVRFKDFLNSDEGIATNILSDRLNKLEENGLVTKSIDPDKRSQMIYAPTQKSKDLIPAVTELMKWSAAYDKDCPAIEKAKEQGLDGPAELIDNFMAGVAAK